MIDIGLLAEELKRDEGFKDKVYKCSAGKLTIAYGHNIEDNPIPERIASLLLDHDIGQAIAGCENAFPWFYPLSPVRKRVIINMVFNIGVSGVSKFKNMIAAIEGEDWTEAGRQMLNSKWRSQVGQRAERLATMMISNEA